ncbi:hypothetical protein [Azotobacter vinelandii]|uniref:hypothetical protein n=1 Tax=Azotobacter vinelandii TaxID=354 RepID=UPI000ADC0BAB|nr:hypothetical protein [Azotobacter vinelandii]WKN19937.1 hypothetical protein AVAEIV_002857 [Azotobacter vinelandii]
MNPTDHQHLIDELDTLLARIATLLQGFESTGCNLSMKADYIALHELQARALKQRQEHAHAMGDDRSQSVLATIEGLH